MRLLDSYSELLIFVMWTKLKIIVSLSWEVTTRSFLCFNYVRSKILHFGYGLSS